MKAMNASSVVLMRAAAVALLALAACSDSGTNSGVEAPDEPPPITEDPQAISDNVTSITGRTLHYRSGAPVAEVIVGTLPTSEARRTNANGEYALTQNVVDSEVYRITGTHPGFAEASTFVITASGRNRNVDMALVPLPEALGVAAEPPALLFGDTQHDVRGLLRNTTKAPVAWSLSGAGAPWVTLEPSSGTLAPDETVRIAARVVPEAFQAAVAAMEPDQRLLRGRLDLEGADGKTTVIHVVAQPAEPGKVTLQWMDPEVAAEQQVLVGETVGLDVSALLESRGMVGVALDARVVHDGTALEVSRRAATDPDGMARLSVVARDVGVATIQVGLPAYPDVPPLQARVVITDPDRAVSPDLSQARAAPPSALADGVAISTVEVAVVDTRNRPFAGQVVAIAVSGDGVELPEGAEAVTDARGFAALPVAATVPEVKTVTVTINPDGDSPVVLTARPEITFTPEATPRAVSADLSSAEVTPPEVLADGLAEALVRVVVRDEEGAPFAGQAVSIAVSGDGVTVGDDVVSDPLGEAEVWLTSTVAEEKTVTVTINPDGDSPVVLTDSPTVTFTPTMTGEVVSAVRSLVALIPETPIVADGAERVAIQVTVLDPEGEPLSGQAIGVEVSGSGNLIDGATVTDASGVAVATLASTVAEEKTITVTVNPEAEAVELAPVQTLFVPPPPRIDPVASSITVTPDHIPANGIATSRVDVTVINTDGEPFAGVTVELALSLDAQVGGAVVTNAQGQASIFVASLTVGESEVRANLQPPEGDAVVLGPEALTFDPLPVSVVQSSFTVTPTTGLIADGLDSALIEAEIVDTLGRPLAGVAVSVLIDGAAQVVANSPQTDANGTFTATLSSFVPGEKGVRLQTGVGGDLALLQQTETVTFLPDLGRLRTDTAIFPDGPLRADGVQDYLVAVFLMEGDEPVTGVGVSLAAPAGGGSLLISNPTTTDSVGRASFFVRSTAPGTFDLEVTLEAGAPNAWTFAGPQLVFAPTLPDVTINSQYKALRTDGILADGTDAALLVLDLFDEEGAGLSGVPVRIESSGASNTIQPASDGVTDGVGRYSVQLTTTVAEEKVTLARIWPDSPDEVVLTPVNVRFIGDAGNLDLLTSTAAVTPDGPLVADGVDAYTIEITLVDQLGNPVPDVTPTIRSSVPGDVITAPGPTDLDGHAAGTLQTTEPGDRDITVVLFDGTDDAVELPPITRTFRDIPGVPSPARSTLTASPGRIIADGVDASRVTATVLDGNGDPVPDVEVSLTTVGVEVGVEQLAAVTDAAGAIAFDLRGGEVGQVVVTAVTEPNGAARPIDQTVTVTVDPDPAVVVPEQSSVVLTPQRVFDADGVDTATLEVTLRNAYGDPVPAREVSGSTSPIGAAVFGGVATTDDAGQASLTLTSTEAGLFTIFVTDALGVTLTDTPEVTFREPPRPNPLTSDLTASPLRAPADGVEAIAVTASAVDQYGSAMDGVAVSWDVQGLPGPFVDTLTDAGLAELLLTADTPGSVTVSATIGEGADAITVGPVTLLFEAVLAPPTMTIEPSGPLRGCSTVIHSVAQEDGAPVWVEMTWQPSAGQPQRATQGRSDALAGFGVTGLEAIPAPSFYSFTWDALRDVGYVTTDVTLEARARTASGATSEVATAVLQVDNGLRFDEQPPVLETGSFEAARLGDLDGDGDQDLVLLGTDPPQILIFFNQSDVGGGLFTGPPTWIFSFVDLRAVEVGDVDGDGDLDIVEVGLESGTIQLRAQLNGGDGLSWTAADPIDTGATEFTGIQLAELDQDRGVEAVLYSPSQVTTVADPLDDLAAAQVRVTLNPTTGLELIDVTGDGLPDRVAVEDGARLVIAPGDGAGGFGGEVVALSGAIDDFEVVDVNNDGLLDVVTHDVAAQAVTVHLGDGAGWVATEPVLVGPADCGVSAVDLEGDGRLDLVACDAAFNALTTWAQLPGGGFTMSARTTLVNPLVASEVISGDLNNDRMADLVLVDTSPFSGQTQIWTGVPIARCGPGVSASPVADTDDLSESTGPSAVADLNRDGRPDLLVADAGSGALRAWLNQGDGTLVEAPVSSPALGPGVTHLEVTRLDADPWLDVIAIHGDAAQLTPLLAQGRFDELLAAPTVAIPDELVDAQVHDVNLDGVADVVLLGGGQALPQVQVLLGVGDGGLTPLAPLLLPGEPLGFGVGQLTADFDPDLLVHTVVAASPFRGNGDGTFTGTGTELNHSSGATVSAALGDADGDSVADVALLGPGGSVEVFINDGFGALTLVMTSPRDATGATRVDLLDLDGDGEAEIVAQGPVAGLEVLSGPAQEAQPLPLEGEARWADFNGDGRLDVVVSGDDVALLLSRPEGGYVAPLREPLAFTGELVRAADLNRDGLTDLLVAGAGGAALSFHAGTAPGAVEEVGRLIPLPAAATAIDVADVNGDGLLDVALACPAAGQVVILVSDGASPLSTSQSIFVPGAAGVALFDSDQDGERELAILAGDQFVEVQILDNDGAGEFGALLALVPLPPDVAEPSDLVVADLEGDGAPELLVAQRPAAVLRVLRRSEAGMWGHADDLAPPGGAWTLEAVAAGDWDRDGRDELVVARADMVTGVALEVWSWDAMVFTQDGASVALPHSPDGLLLGDVDNDGRLDAALIASATERVVWARQEEAGDVSLSAWALLGAADVTLNDWNRDGLPDLLSVGQAQTLSVQLAR